MNNLTNKITKEPLIEIPIVAFFAKAGFQRNAFHFINKMLYDNIADTLNIQFAARYLGEALMKIVRKEVFYLKKFSTNL